MEDYVIAEPAADVDGAPVIVNVNEPVEQSADKFPERRGLGVVASADRDAVWTPRDVGDAESVEGLLSVLVHNGGAILGVEVFVHTFLVKG